MIFRPLFPRDYIRCFSFDRRQAGARSKSGSHRGKKNLMPFSEIKPNSSVVQLIHSLVTFPFLELFLSHILAFRTVANYRRTSIPPISYGIIAVRWNNGVPYSRKAVNFLKISMSRHAPRTNRPPVKWATSCLTPGILPAGSWNSLASCPLQNFVVRCLPLKNVIRVMNT